MCSPRSNISSVWYTSTAMCSLASRVPREKMVAKMLKVIHAQESRAAAQAKARDVVVALREMKLSEVEDGQERTPVYTVFPYEHRTRIRTNNVIWTAQP